MSCDLGRLWSLDIATVKRARADTGQNRCQESAMNRGVSVSEKVSEKVGIVQAASRIQWLLNEFYGFFPWYRHHGLGCDKII